MDSRDHRPESLSQPFILGGENFAAITAIEGLQLSPEAKLRFAEMESLNPAERRAETIRHYQATSGVR